MNIAQREAKMKPAQHLPDCMMPDGADPCLGYQELHAECTRLTRERDEDRAAITLLTRELDACEGALKNSGHVVDITMHERDEARARAIEECAKVAEEWIGRANWIDELYAAEACKRVASFIRRLSHAHSEEEKG